MPSFAQLAAWGWMERHEPVDPLDDYDGYRPTKEGSIHLIHDEKYHLILIKKEHVEAVHNRVLGAANVMLDAAMASHMFKVRSMRERGWRPDENAKELPGFEAALARHIRRGYMPLERFQDLYGIGHDQLIVAGVLRYLEHRDPEKIPNIDVGHKARHCLMCSTRWQTFFVRPGMEDELLGLCSVDEHF